MDRIVVGHNVPLVVGIVREPWLTVIVKLSYSLAGARPQLIAPAAFSMGHAEQSFDGSKLLGDATDWVFRRTKIDVWLGGHAYASEPRAQIDADVAVNDLARRLSVRAGSAAERIPLTDPYVFDRDGRPSPVAPRPMLAARALGAPLEEKTQSARDGISAAAPFMTLDEIEGPIVLKLDGLSKLGFRRAELPPTLVQIFVEAGDNGLGTLTGKLDTIQIDTDLDVVSLVYRSALDLPPNSERLERILIHCTVDGRSLLAALDPSKKDPSNKDLPKGGLAGDELTYAEVLRDLPRGKFSMACEPTTNTPEAVDDDERDELEMARLEAMGYDVAPEPRLTLQQYAAISAELAEQKAERKVVLERHDMTEDEFMLEERAWLERLADEAVAGDGTQTASYGEEFVAAQDALAEPKELRRGVDEYAELSVLVERAPRPDVLLARRQLTLSEWMRLDRRMMKAAEEDPAFARELEQKIAEVEARFGDDDVDEEGESAILEGFEDQEQQR